MKCYYHNDLLLGGTWEKKKKAHVTISKIASSLLRASYSMRNSGTLFAVMDVRLEKTHFQWLVIGSFLPATLQLLNVHYCCNFFKLRFHFCVCLRCSHNLHFVQNLFVIVTQKQHNPFFVFFCFFCLIVSWAKTL